MRLVAPLLAALIALAPAAQATPTTVVWSPATAAIQPFGVAHLTYDTYFGAGVYPVDVGLTAGLLPLDALQLEVGVDLNYPTIADGEPMALPLQLNAKLAIPEGALFAGQPGLAVGVYGVGFEADVTDPTVLYAVLGETFVFGTLAVGGYYGVNERLLVSPEGRARQAGLLASWTSPTVDVPIIDKLGVAWDLQTGANALAATGGAVALYLTPSVALLTGPVFYLEPKLQPGGASWLWTVQLDVDLDFNAPEAAAR